MKLAPFGTMHAWQQTQLTDPFKKTGAFKGTDAQYRKILKEWYAEMQAAIWPIFDKQGKWDGKSAKFADRASKAEIEICLKHFQRKGILRELPKSIDPAVPEAYKRDHLWHYMVEDAKYFAKGDGLLTPLDHSFEYRASKDVGANFAGYSNAVPEARFAEWFWKGGRARQPEFFSIKNEFQRPRPWTAAMLFRLDDFVWHQAESFVHTGIHPAFPSGHCFQGIVHGANAYNEWLNAADDGDMAPPSDDALKALMQYAVDWGDHRVFAGVHYPTDNIASWIMAVRLLPHMYSRSKEMTHFAHEAITTKSLVYKVIQREYGKRKALRPALDLLNKYIPPKP